MSDNIKATVFDLETGRILAHVEAQDPADLAIYETDEHSQIEGHWDPQDYFVNPATRRANKHKSNATRPQIPIERQWAEVRNKRNGLIEAAAWTIRADSPLPDADKEAWLAYLKALQAVTKDLDDPAAVVWPEPPALPFPDNSGTARSPASL